jgi:hypothetical protein
MESGLALLDLRRRRDGTDLGALSTGWVSDSSAQRADGIIAAEIILESP